MRSAFRYLPLLGVFGAFASIFGSAQSAHAQIAETMEFSVVEPRIDQVIYALGDPQICGHLTPIDGGFSGQITIQAGQSFTANYEFICEAADAVVSYALEIRTDTNISDGFFLRSENVTAHLEVKGLASDNFWFASGTQDYEVPASEGVLNEPVEDLTTILGGVTGISNVAVTWTTST